MRQETIRYQFDAVSNLPTVEAQMLRIVQLTQAMSATMAQSTTQILQSLAQQTAALNQVTTAQNANTAAVNAGSANQVNATNRVNASTQSLVSQLRDMRTIIGASFSVYEIVEFGQQIIDAKSKIDIFKTGLTQMIGSKREMNEVYDQMIQLAVKTPFEVEKLFETTFMLKGMGVATKELLPTMEALGNMAAVAGQDKLPLIAKAFTDVMNKGKLMKQEINQFAENGIPLYDLLSASMGKSREEVVKMAEAHTISFADVKKAIMDASKEGGKYYQMMTLASETLGGQVSNLKDRFFVAKGVIGDFYENALSKTIGGLKELIVEVAGSGSAIQRTQKIVESVVVAYTTWKLVGSGLLEMETLLKVATVTRAAVTEGLSIAVGTANLAHIAFYGTTQLLNAEQVRGAVVARAFWAALLSNPITAIVAVVGAATAAYLAWSAATTEVSQAVTDQQFQLEKERKNIEIDIQNALALTGNREKQLVAIQNLINKYPDYFAGMSAEQVKNWQLRQTLESVNTSYRNRIALAAEAYRAEANEEKFKELIKKQVEIMDIAKQRLGASFMELYGQTPEMLLKALRQSSANMETFMGTYSQQWDWLKTGHIKSERAILEEVVRGQKAYGDEVLAGQDRVAKIKQQGVDADMVAERRRHQNVEAQLKAANDGTAKDVAEFEQKMAAEKKLYHANLLKINGQYHEAEQGQEVIHGGKVKTIRAASAAAIKEQELRSHQDNLFDKIKYLKALEDLEVENANKAVVSTKASEADKAAARESSLKKIAAIHEATEKKIQALWAATADALLKDVDDWVSAEQEANLAVEVANTKTNKQIKAEAKATAAERKKSAKEIAEEVAGYEQQIQQSHKESTAFQAQQSRIQAGLWIDMVSQMGGAAGEMGKQVKAIWSNWDIISGKSMESAKARYDAAEKDHAMYLNMFLAGDKAAEASAARSAATMAQSQQEMQVTSAATKTAVLGLVSIGLQAISQLIGKFQELRAATTQQIIESLKKAEDSVKSFYDLSLSMNKESLDIELSNYKDNYDKRGEIIKEYYSREREMVTNRDAITAALANATELAEGTLKIQNGKLKAGFERDKEYAELQLALEKNKLTRMYQAQINQAEIDKQEAADDLQNKLDKIAAELDAFKDAVQKKIDLVKDESDQKKQALQDTLDAAKDAYQKEVDAAKDAYDKQVAALKDKQSQEEAALRATYELKAQLLAQSTGDEVEKIGIIDRARLEALERYRTDEVARLQATRDRILLTLTDEGERARVTQEYDQRIADVHKQVEEAKLDKTKGVSLATTQLRNEEKDAAVRLKEEEQAARDAMDARYQEMFKTMAAERDVTLQVLKDAQVKREEETQAAIRKLEADTKEKIAALQDQIKQKEVDSAQEKKKANYDYKVAVINANNEIFEATKAMKVAELRAEQAILRSKRNFLNAGKINAAIDEIDGAINSISGLSLAYQANLAEYLDANDLNSRGNPKKPITLNGRGILDFPVFDKAGNPIQISYKDSEDVHTVYDAQGNEVPIMQASGYVPATGERFAKGTEYVEGEGYRDGIDTVPAWLTKGERVLTVAENALLRGIDNAELVRRSVLFDQLPLLSSPMLGGSLPDLAGASGGSVDLGGLGQKLDSLRDALANQKQLNVNIDRNGFRLYEVGNQSVTTYHTNMLTR